MDRFCTVLHTWLWTTVLCSFSHFQLSIWFFYFHCVMCFENETKPLSPTWCLTMLIFNCVFSQIQNVVFLQFKNFEWKHCYNVLLSDFVFMFPSMLLCISVLGWWWTTVNVSLFPYHQWSSFTIFFCKTTPGTASVL